MREAPDGSFTYPDIEKTEDQEYLRNADLAMYDDVVVFIPFETAGKMMQVPANQVTNYEVTFSSIDDLSVKAKKDRR